MVIVYADDEPAAQRQVLRALESRGHTVLLLDTGSKARLEADAARLLDRVRAGVQIKVFILDGHNLVNDEEGHLLADMTPLGILNWLYRNGLNAGCHFVLFSNDSQMIWQARHDSPVRFTAAISKLGRGGGLKALLSCIEKLEKHGLGTGTDLLPGNRP